MLKTLQLTDLLSVEAYHLGEGRVLKTSTTLRSVPSSAYHLGEGRVLKTETVLLF